MAKHADDAADSSPPATGAAHIVDLIRQSIPPMHPGGRPLVAAAAGATLGGRLLLRLVGLRRTSRLVGKVGMAATAGTALFFRSPNRVAPSRPNTVVAPADGLIAVVDTAVPPAELGLGSTPRPRVSIFLSLLDVHAQRIPIAGTVSAVAYHPGKFLSADLDKASEDNERNSIVIDRPDGTSVVVTQIAGLLARRIVCDVAVGDDVATGFTYGLIRFGSRVDTYLPVGSELKVHPGQRTIGGETVFAELT